MDPGSLSLGLAPMQGVADPMMRAQLGALGGIDYCVTEFIRIGGMPLAERVALRLWPEAEAGGRTADGTPVHPQLLGSHEGRMIAGAELVVRLGASVIDLNFGCPVRKVNGHGGGAALLRDPRSIERVVAAVRTAVPQTVQISAKLRLGWDNPDDVVQLARAAEAGGASMVTIHGRTRSQRYSDQADWARIGLARESISIPVIANGDIRSPEDLQRCRALSGCTRFLIGRGAIERPELFRVLSGMQRGFWHPAQRLAFVARCVQKRAEAGEPAPNSLGRLKGWCQAMGRVDPGLRQAFESIKECTTLSQAFALLGAEGRTPLG
jgi:tRNA-dihydrouridine synthase C